VLVAVGPDLLRAWLGAESFAEAGVALQFLAVGILVNAIGYVPSAYLHSINRPDLPAKMHLLELPVFLGLAWLLMPRFGAAGAGAVWFVRATLDTALLHAASTRNGMSRFEPGAAGLLIAGLGTAAVAAHLVPGLLPRLAVTAALLAGFLWLGWQRLLSADDRRHLMALLRPASA
jgi:O-antigen/teichoic acid export membrane protein